MSVLGQPWRVGGQVGRTLYVDPAGRGGKDPAYLFGMVDEDEIAAHIVTLHNRWLEANQVRPVMVHGQEVWASPGVKGLGQKQEQDDDA